MHHINSQINASLLGGAPPFTNVPRMLLNSIHYNDYNGGTPPVVASLASPRGSSAWKNCLPVACWLLLVIKPDDPPI